MTQMVDISISVMPDAIRNMQVNLQTKGDYDNASKLGQLLDKIDSWTDEYSVLRSFLCGEIDTD